ncbi:MAG: hypothetical protein MHM6MM_000999 [Cercozoa sp. M6MM]
MQAHVDKLKLLYRKHTCAASVVGGRVHDAKHLSLTFSQNDLARDQRPVSQLHYTATDAEWTRLDVPAVYVDRSAKLVSTHDSLGLYLKSHKNKDIEETWLDVVELATGHIVSSTRAKTAHGKILANDPFGTPSFSPCGTKVVYVAEKAAGKSREFFNVQDDWDVILEDKDDDSKSAENEKLGESFLFEDDYGELLVDVRCPRVYVLHLESKRVTPLSSPSLHSAFAPVFAPCGTRVVYCATPEHPRRFGLRFYSVRPTQLVVSPVGSGVRAETSSVRADEQQHTVLTPDLYCCSRPSFSPDGSQLTFLCSPEEDWHHWTTKELRAMQWSNNADGNSNVLVPLVYKAKPGEFPGLYPAYFPANASWIDTHTMLVTTQWNSETALVLIDTVTGKVTRVASPVKNGSAAILHLNSAARTALVSFSSHAHSGSVYTIDHVGTLRLVRSGAPTETVMRLIDHTVSESDQWFQSVLLTRPGQARPVLLYLHGGPHSAITTAHAKSFEELLELGYDLVCVNYRGSIGFGHECLASLPGKIGEQDVSDCVAALEHCAALHLGKEVDEDLATWAARRGVGVFGGSHGGFLTLHLLGQHASLFRAGVALNPVADMAAMSAHTDIPDWVQFEATGKPGNVHPTSADFARFHAQSPAAHSNKVVSPTLLLLGGSDRRVPFPGALAYRNRLRARGVECRTHFYATMTHGLRDVVAQQADVDLNKLLWLERHVRRVDALAPADSSDSN